MDQGAISVDTVIYVILTIAAGCSVIVGAALSIRKLLSPFLHLIDRINSLEDKQEDICERLDGIDKRFECIDEMYVQFALAMVALLEHAETGNSTGKLSKARKNLNEYFIKRQV